MTLKNKYANRSKISEKKIRQIVKLFSIDLDASQIPSPLTANSANARENVDSDDISPMVANPQIRLRFLVARSARIKSLVVGTRYSVLATNARAKDCRSRGLRPLQ